MTGARGVSRECRDWGGDGRQEWPGTLPAFFPSGCGCLGCEWVEALWDCHGSGSRIIGRKGTERELRSRGRPSQPASPTLPLSWVDRPVSQHHAGGPSPWLLECGPLPCLKLPRAFWKGNSAPVLTLFRHLD